MAKNGGKRPGAGRKPGVPNRTNQELRALAQQYTEEAVATAAAIMRNDDEPAPARIKAVEILLGYGHGKPRQALEHTGKDGGPIEHDTVEAREARKARVRELLAPLTEGSDVKADDAAA